MMTYFITIFIFIISTISAIDMNQMGFIVFKWYSLQEINNLFILKKKDSPHLKSQ